MIKNLGSLDIETSENLHFPKSEEKFAKSQGSLNRKVIDSISISVAGKSGKKPEGKIKLFTVKGRSGDFAFGEKIRTDPVLSRQLRKIHLFSFPLFFSFLYNYRKVYFVQRIAPS